MRHPRIGIPLCLDDRERWRAGREYQYIDRSYADAVARAGGTPILLPIQQEIGPLIKSLDGVLIPGGDDLPPDEPLPPAAAAELDLVPAAQLAFDTALLRAALEADRPVLGICYGMQLLARIEGGQLDAHLPTNRPEIASHKLADPDARHALGIEADSRLARALGSMEGTVNSFHHQAIRSVGPTQRVVARSPDGLIEAIEAASPHATFTLGVQWHPEKMDDAASAGLFSAFVAACRAVAFED